MSYQSKYRNRNSKFLTTKQNGAGKFKALRKLNAKEIIALATAHPEDWYIPATEDHATENAKTYGVSKFKIMVCYDIQEGEDGKYEITKLDEKKRYELRTKFNNIKSMSSVKPAEQAKKQNKYNEQKFSTRLHINNFNLSEEELKERITVMAIEEVKRLESHMEIDAKQFDDFVETEIEAIKNRYDVWYAQYLIDKRYQDIVSDETEGNIIDKYNVPMTGDAIKSFLVYNRKFNAESDDKKYKPMRGESEYTFPLDKPMVYHTVSGDQKTDELWGKYKQLVMGPDGKFTTQVSLIVIDGKEQPLNTRNIGNWLITGSAINLTEKYHICIHSKGISLKSNIVDLVAKIPEHKISYAEDTTEDLEALNMGVGIFKNSAKVLENNDTEDIDGEDLDGEDIDIDGLDEQLRSTDIN